MGVLGEHKQHAVCLRGGRGRQRAPQQAQHGEMWGHGRGGQGRHNWQLWQMHGVAERASSIKLSAPHQGRQEETRNTAAQRASNNPIRHWCSSVSDSRSVGEAQRSTQSMLAYQATVPAKLVLHICQVVQHLQVLVGDLPQGVGGR